MKKITILSLLIIVTTTMQAQTFYGSGLYLNADPDGVYFDLSNPDLYNGFVLEVREYTTDNVVIDLGAELQSIMSGGSGTFYIPWVSPYGYNYSPSTTFSFDIGTEYYVYYYFPSTWQFDYYTHNPFTSFGVNVYLFDEDDNYLGIYQIGRPDYSHTEYSTHWHCYGTAVEHYTTKKTFNLSGIQPTWNYADLYYDEVDEIIPNCYMDIIDHVRLGISFRNN